VFVSERRAPLTTDAVRKIVGRAGREAGIDSRSTRTCCAMPRVTKIVTKRRYSGPLGSLAHIVPQPLRRMILADGHGADAGQVRVRQLRFGRPCIELGLNFCEVPL
jgi:hypothetical protein